MTTAEQQRAYDQKYARDPAHRAAKVRRTAAWRKANPDAVAAMDATKYRKWKEYTDTFKVEPCMDCGGSFPPECMDFDHRPGEEKSANVALIRSKAAFLAEIAKCDLVCANCHRTRTKNRKRK